MAGLFAPAGQYPSLFGGPTVSGSARPPPPPPEEDGGILSDLGDLAGMFNPVGHVNMFYRLGKAGLKSLGNIPHYIAPDEEDEDRPRIQDDPVLNEVVKPMVQSAATTLARLNDVPFRPEGFNPGNIAVQGLSNITGATPEQTTRSLFGKDEIPGLEDYRSKPFTSGFEDITNLGMAAGAGIGAASKATGLASRLANAGTKVARVLPEAEAAAGAAAETAAKVGAVAETGVADAAGRVSVAADRAAPTVSGSSPELIRETFESVPKQPSALVGADAAETARMVRDIEPILNEWPKSVDVPAPTARPPAELLSDISQAMPERPLTAPGAKGVGEYLSETLNKWEPAPGELREPPAILEGLLKEAEASKLPAGELLAERYIETNRPTAALNAPEKLAGHFNKMVESAKGKAATETADIAGRLYEEAAGTAAAATEAAVPAPPSGPAVAGAAPLPANTAKNPLASRLFEASENLKQARHDISLHGLMERKYVNRAGQVTSAGANVDKALSIAKDKALTKVEQMFPSYNRATRPYSFKLTHRLRTEGAEPLAAAASTQAGKQSLINRQSVKQAQEAGGRFGKIRKENRKLADNDPDAFLRGRGDVETATTVPHAAAVFAEENAASAMRGKAAGVGEEAVGAAAAQLHKLGTFEQVNAAIDTAGLIDGPAPYRISDTAAGFFDAQRARNNIDVVPEIQRPQVLAEAATKEAAHAERLANDTDYATHFEKVDRPIAEQMQRNETALAQHNKLAGTEAGPGEYTLNRDRMTPAQRAEYDPALERRTVLADDLARVEQTQGTTYQAIKEAADDPALSADARQALRDNPVYDAGRAAEESINAVRDLEQQMLGTGITPAEYTAMTPAQKALLPPETVQHFELRDHVGHILSDEAHVAENFTPEQAAQLRQMYAGSASTLVDLNGQGVRMEFLPGNKAADPAVLVHSSDYKAIKTKITTEVMDELYADPKYSRSSEELFNDIPEGARSRLPDATIEQQIADHYKGKWAQRGDGSDRWIAKDLEEKVINYSNKGMDSSFNKAAAGLYDPAQNVWRLATLFFSPAYHLNNIVGGFVLSTLVGSVNVKDYIPRMVAAAKLAKRGGEITPDMFKGLSGKLAKRGLKEFEGQSELVGDITRRATPESLINAEVGPHGGPSTAGAYPKLFGKHVTAGVNAATKYSGLQGIYHVSRRFAETVDNMNRIGTALDKAAKTGVGAKEAVALAARALPSVQEFGPFEKLVVRRLYPFYGWMKHIGKVGLQLSDPSQLLNRSIIMAKLSQLYGKDDPESALLPFYRKGSIKLGDNNWLSTKAIYPLSDILGYADAENIPQALLKPMGPIPKLFIGQATNVDVGTGRPYTSPYPDEEGNPRHPSIQRLITSQFRQARLAEDISAGLQGHPLERYSTGESRYTTTTTPKQLWQSLAQAAGASVFSFDPQQESAQHDQRVISSYRRSVNARAKMAAREGNVFTPDPPPKLKAYASPG